MAEVDKDKDTEVDAEEVADEERDTLSVVEPEVVSVLVCVVLGDVILQSINLPP